jgi:hypothetical protein
MALLPLSHDLTKGELNELLDEFNELDNDDDGIISTKDLQKTFKDEKKVKSHLEFYHCRDSINWDEFIEIRALELRDINDAALYHKDNFKEIELDYSKIPQKVMD